MISYRYFWHVCILLLLTLYPTVTNFYLGLPSVKNEISFDIPPIIDGITGVQTIRNKAYINAVFSTDNWVEKEYSFESGETITLFAARGYDGKTFIHFPERGLLSQSWSQRTHTIKKMSGVKQPSEFAHYLTLSGSVGTTRVVYLLFCGKKTIGNPYLYLLKKLPFMLFGGREVFTLLFVSTNDQNSDNGMEKVIGAILSYGEE